MNDELLPCPFCGGEAWIVYSWDKPMATCKEHKCRVSAVGEIANWNTRPIEEALRAENERLKRQLDEWAPIMYAHGFIKGESV